MIGCILPCKNAEATIEFLSLDFDEGSASFKYQIMLYYLKNTYKKLRLKYNPNLGLIDHLQRLNYRISSKFLLKRKDHCAAVCLLTKVNVIYLKSLGIYNVEFLLNYAKDDIEFYRRLHMMVAEENPTIDVGTFLPYMVRNYIYYQVIKVESVLYYSYPNLTVYKKV